MRLDLSHKDSKRDNNIVRLFKFIVTKECITLQNGCSTLNDNSYDKLDGLCERFVMGNYSGIKDDELDYLKSKWVETNEWYEDIDQKRRKYCILEVRFW